MGFSPWVGKIPWSRKWQPTPAFLLGKFHIQGNQGGYSPGVKNSYTTQHAHEQIDVGMDKVDWEVHNPGECCL